MHIEGHEPWYVGTWTLAGVIIGIGVGFIIHQPPPIIAAALAVGAGLDLWFYNRTAR